MYTTHASLVVAVGRRDARAVIDFAATEALRQHRGLHLVHGMDAAALARLPEVHRATELAALEDAASDTLGAAVRHATAAVGGVVPVTSTLSQAGAVAAVYAASHDAPLVVVGRHPESRSTHPYVRSVTGGLAARLHVPVVAVPDTWSDVGAPDHVVVGIDHPEQSVPVLRAAFRAARDRGALLTVVTSRWDPTAYVHDPDGFARDHDWPERLRAAVEDVLPDLRSEYADVPVEIHVRKARPGEVLIDASRHACLMVLGRHDPMLPRDSHLGPIARSVLVEAACPVLLTTPRRQSGIRRSRHLDPQPA